MHKHYMQAALEEAKIAFEKNEVPVGAIIVYQDEIIARAHNTRETTQNPLDHAEMIAIRKASEHLNTWKLNECTLYVTLEPCIMCAGSILQSRIGTVVYGTKDPKGGSFGSSINLNEVKGFNHYPYIVEGVCEKESAAILKEFFAKRRKQAITIKQVTKEEEFNKIKDVRYQVFVNEQNVDADIEYDEYDDLSRDDVIHLMAIQNETVIGTLRLIKEGKTLIVGRVAVLKKYRNQKIGLKLMAYAETHACNHGFTALKLGAQLTAIPFYEKSGYEAYGEIFMDANIEHKMMQKKCR